MEPLAVRQYLPKLRKKTLELLEHNTRTAYKDGRKYTYTVPSFTQKFFKNKPQYPFQWFWDSWLIARVLLQLNIERAKDEIRSLLVWQEPNGFLPQVIFWDQSQYRRALWHWHYWQSKGLLSFLPWRKKPQTSADIQPPGIAKTVEDIWEKDGDHAFVEEVLPALARYYFYLLSFRDPDNDGLISVISQVESGIDYSPAYDHVIGVSNPGPWSLFLHMRWIQVKNKILFHFNLNRIFRWTNYHVEDVLVNSICAESLFALAKLATISRHPIFVGADKEPLHDWALKQAEKTRDALLRKCYDPEAKLFWNLAGKKEHPCKVKTFASLLPLIVPGLPDDVVDGLIAHLVNPKEFWTPYPVASVARNEPTFSSDNRLSGRFTQRYRNRYRFLWRGAVFNLEKHFFIRGLRQYGRYALAENLHAIWLRNAYYHCDFNEANDALSGLPVETPWFSWAALVVSCYPTDKETKENL